MTKCPSLLLDGGLSSIDCRPLDRRHDRPSTRRPSLPPTRVALSTAFIILLLFLPPHTSDAPTTAISFIISCRTLTWLASLLLLPFAALPHRQGRLQERQVTLLCQRRRARVPRLVLRIRRADPLHPMPLQGVRLLRGGRAFTRRRRVHPARRPRLGESNVPLVVRRLRREGSLPALRLRRVLLLLGGAAREPPRPA